MRKMNKNEIKEYLNRKYGNRKKTSFIDYQSGKNFINNHIEDASSYDELNRHLVDVLNL